MRELLGLGILSRLAACVVEQTGPEQGKQVFECLVVSEPRVGKGPAESAVGVSTAHRSSCRRRMAGVAVG
jgi:hypothetical protein